MFNFDRCGLTFFLGLLGILFLIWSGVSMLLSHLSREESVKKSLKRTSYVFLGLGVIFGICECFLVGKYTPIFFELFKH